MVGMGFRRIEVYTDGEEAYGRRADFADGEWQII